MCVCVVCFKSQAHAWNADLCMGRRDSSVVERQTHDQTSQVQVQAGAARELSSPGSTFCADSYFNICSVSVLLQ